MQKQAHSSPVSDSQSDESPCTLPVICAWPPSLPIICTLLDGLASPSVPVSPILDFVLAYQVTLIEIRKCTAREGEQKIFRKPLCVVGKPSFWTWWVLARGDVSAVDKGENIEYKQREHCLLSDETDGTQGQTWLLISYSLTVWFELVVKTCCIILESFTVRPDVLFCW